MSVKPSSKRYRLSRELAIVLLIKCIVLYILWLCFFAHPLADSLSRKDIGNHLFSASAPSLN